VLILGAASDIAKAVAYALARAGYDLVLAVRKPEVFSEVGQDIQIRHEVDVKVVRFDAVDFKSHPTFYDEISGDISIVICAFGYLGDQSKGESVFDEVLETIETNLTGAISILNVIAGDFERRQSGTIIGISSVAGDRGRKTNYHYGVAKAGFTAYLSGLRARLHTSKVHVMTVKPGFVRTKMTRGMPVPRFLESGPELVARQLLNALKKKKDVVYIPRKWKYIMLAVRHIPESIFKKLSI